VQKKIWGDQQIENAVGNLLRAGVMLSAFVVLMGAFIYLPKWGGSPVEFRVFQGEPADLRGISGIIRDAFAFHGRGIIQFGLLLLIATPIARVIFSIFGFAAERDHIYVMFTCVVLAILLYSLLGSA
jgi:uncharacterized membrane protein